MALTPCGTHPCGTNLEAVGSNPSTGHSPLGLKNNHMPPKGTQTY